MCEARWNFRNKRWNTGWPKLMNLQYTVRITSSSMDINELKHALPI
jgi:hypothetical protein